MRALPPWLLSIKIPLAEPVPRALGWVRARCVGIRPLLEVVQISIDERGVLDAGDHFALAVGPLVWQRPLLAGCGLLNRSKQRST